MLCRRNCSNIFSIYYLWIARVVKKWGEMWEIQYLRSGRIVLKTQIDTLYCIFIGSCCFGLETRVIIKISTPSLLAKRLWLIFMGMKLKIFSFWKKKSKMTNSKKLRFSKSPILKLFLRKFHRLVLGLVGLIDAKDIDVAVRLSDISSKTAKKHIKCIFSLFFSLRRTAS